MADGLLFLTESVIEGQTPDLTDEDLDHLIAYLTNPEEANIPPDIRSHWAK